MSVQPTSELTSQTETFPDWEPPLPPTDLIFDDGEPMESNRHRIAMNLLIRSVQYGLRERNDIFVGGNMFIYYSSRQARNRDFRGPDFFAVLGVDNTKSRQGWVVWDEEGRYPNVIIELLSESTAQADLNEKKGIYERIFRTPSYFVYDPFDPNRFQGWKLKNGLGYESLVPNEQGRLWCEPLGFWLGTWEGTIDQETAIWLRFFDSEGNLVLLPEEAEKQRADQAEERASQAEERANLLAERLRELGIDPN